jgi:hypothetical protein
MAIYAVSCNNSSRINDSKGNKGEQTMSKEAKVKAGPPVIIYKTKSDYNNLVPVTLNPEKSEIASFPGVKDIFLKGELATPTILSNGYLLDNRGIDENVAFLDITYEDYSQLEKTPDKEELFQKILDSDPLTEMYRCGTRFDYKNLVEELNRKIENNELGSCEKLK